MKRTNTSSAALMEGQNVLIVILPEAKRVEIPDGVIWTLVEQYSLKAVHVFFQRGPVRQYPGMETHLLESSNPRQSFTQASGVAVNDVILTDPRDQNTETLKGVLRSVGVPLRFLSLADPFGQPQG